MREYNKSICVKMTQEEYDKIHERMELLGTINMSAYIRKMALNGFIIDIRWPELKELLRLSNIMGNNLNQYAKKAKSRKYIEQMWAEVMYYYHQGETKLKLPEEMEKHLSEYQAPFMPDDSWKGLIIDWLEKTNCQIVCVQQIYNEALKYNGKPKNSEAREIGSIMRTLTSDWIEFPNPRQIPGYGKQRGWMKLETNSGNKDQNFQTIENTQTENP